MTILSEAIALAESKLGAHYWMFGKGRLRLDEPLYGFVIFDPDDGLFDPIVEAEADDPVDCVMDALQQFDSRETDQ